jgi:hypothetical protein
MLLRDEQDIIVQNLTHLLTWIDNLYILDLGSTDGTWDIVQDFAARDKRIVPFKRSPIIYTDNLRSYIFSHFRDRFDPGDWILKIDADEFYHVTPPDFVSQRLRPLETAVWLQWYFFRLSRREVADYDSGKVDVMADRQRAIEDRRRYYKVSMYSEPRMFRYRRAMQWPQKVSFPFNAGYVARQRIPIRHYPHRDPLQMQARFRLRAKMMSLKAHAGAHWKLDDWRAEIVDERGVADSSQGNKRGLAGEDGIDSGPLYFWEPGTPLREEAIFTHLPSAGERLMGRIVHPLLLPVLDPTRPVFDRSYEPELIPEQVQLALELESLGATRVLEESSD